MGNVIMCAGGGGVKSDDVTAKLANVLEGKTALTSDSDDDIGTGTMPECGAITLAPTGNNTLTSGGGHYDSVTADGSLAYAAGAAAKKIHFVKLGDCSTNPVPDLGVASGNCTYSFDVSKYAQYGITADNLIIRNACGHADANDDYRGWSDRGTTTPSCALSGNTAYAYCPYYYSRKKWDTGEPQGDRRCFSIYSTCELWICYAS